MTDQEIIDCVLGGDREAFGELVRRYQDAVYRMALRRIRSERDAEDVAQEVFLNAYRRLTTYEGNAQFSTWLYRITFNTCIDWMRKASRTPALQFAPGQEGDIVDSRINLTDDLTAEYDRNLVEAAVGRLAWRYRHVVELYYFEQLSYAEIGRIVGMSEKGVESRLYRARRLLRRALEARGA
jgi:RNA polymerase sigma-70 factor, ECF subfamily